MQRAQATVCDPAAGDRNAVAALDLINLAFCSCLTLGFKLVAPDLIAVDMVTNEMAGNSWMPRYCGTSIIFGPK